MKPAVPREIVDPGRGLEKEDRRLGGRRRLAGDAPCEARDPEIIQPADESAFDALCEEFRESIHEEGSSNQVYSRYYTGKL
jgi:hypothetical protein